MSYRVSTQVYSGPFDLLLQLVTRQKVDIGAISISEVAEQYLAEAERIEALDLDVASDFLLVAATLLDIKAASLVPQEAPRKSDDDDEDDDRDDDPDSLHGHGDSEQSHDCLPLFFVQARECARSFRVLLPIVTRSQFSRKRASRASLIILSALTRA